MLNLANFSIRMLAVVLCCLFRQLAFAESGDECNEISRAINSSSDRNPVAVDKKWLENSKLAEHCLATEIGKIGSKIGPFDRTNAAKMLTATGALREIMERGVAPSNAQQISPELHDFIDEFRFQADRDLSIISALSFGLRDDIAELRLNSVLVVGNVIDDDTVCVPLTHLNDKGLATTPIGARGRANLLSVVSVAAPWTTRQNFDTILATRSKIASTISRDDPNFTSSIALLDNIEKRTNSQTNETNKNYSMDDDQLTLCRKYIDDAKHIMNIDAGNLKY